jgi:GH15 family glucan-1,4-alpha-glucosidase
MAALSDMLELAPGVRGGEAATMAGEPMPGRDAQPYRAIRDYAMIGDCHGAALVCRDGSIDWCCLGRFDAEPVFARILDAERGGCFSIAPPDPVRSVRRYLDESAILVTHFADRGGRANLIDFMPVGHRPGSRRRDATRLAAPGWVVRVVIGVAGRMDFELVFRPIRGLRDRRPSGLRRVEAAVVAADEATLHGSLPLALEEGEARASFSLGEGEAQGFILARAPVAGLDPLAAANRLLGVTRRFWAGWIGECRYDGTHQAIVRRSAVTLKLLSYAPTGAMVAAPTTSLPERIGGPRNFDYRFCWMRDAAYMLYALSMLGYGAEAQAYVGFLKRRHLRRDGIHLMYGVAGDPVPGEEDLEAIGGYRDSRPVRVGNAASGQRQNDIYGETLDLALLYRALGGALDRGERRALVYLADCAARSWREPDNGIWEVRSEQRHFVYSKIMCWVALDRAARLFGDRPSWAAARRDICRAVHEAGVRKGRLAAAFDENGMDAALLLTPWLDFPIDAQVMRRTVAAAIEELGEGHYLRRYRFEDGMGGEEGAFLMSIFSLAGALLRQGDRAAASTLFERLVTKANDVGLFAEEIDPRSEAFLGNFPQGFVHLAVVNLANHLALDARHGPAALRGTHADRARRHIGGGPLLGPLAPLRRIAEGLASGASRRSILEIPGSGDAACRK